MFRPFDVLALDIKFGIDARILNPARAASIPETLQKNQHESGFASAAAQKARREEFLFTVASAKAESNPEKSDHARAGDHHFWAADSWGVGKPFQRPKKPGGLPRRKVTQDSF
jgi:hypothetical protein